MLVHIHIPKNAGSTIHSILDREFKQHHYSFYTDRRGNFLSDVEFQSLLNSIPKDTQCFSGHDIRPLDFATSKELNLHYFTFIRHPIERAISLYFFEKSRTQSSHISHASFQEYIQERPTHDNAISNWQVQNLTSEASFEAAKSTLEQFLFVGLVEHFDKSLLLFNKALTNKGMPKINTIYASKNVSKAKTLNRSSIDQESREKLEALNTEDIKLWEYTKNLIEQQWDELENGSRELSRFHLQKQAYSSFFNFRNIVERSARKTARFLIKKS
jgi:hypothetical protein